mmetsp:Transcript_39337/g.80591  ORF Transcript_39337/g.80591 Transcript_39337/m.80591 type:complete len:80 (+) Transcript_39337:124-363(+)
MSAAESGHHFGALPSRGYDQLCPRSICREVLVQGRGLCFNRAGRPGLDNRFRLSWFAERSGRRILDCWKGIQGTLIACN